MSSESLVYRTNTNTKQLVGSNVLDAVLPVDMSEAEHLPLRALILDELRRLHEGVLQRYCLWSSKVLAWKDAQGL